MPNGAKQGQAGSNGAKKGQKKASRGQTWSKGPTGPNVAKWAHIGLIFLHARIFLKSHVLQPRLSDKNWPSYGDIVIFWNIIGAH